LGQIHSFIWGPYAADNGMVLIEGSMLTGHMHAIVWDESKLVLECIKTGSVCVKIELRSNRG
jgi:hypothetical protein